MSLRLVHIIVLLTIPAAALADIYEYVDKNGVAHYTNDNAEGKLRKVIVEPTRISVVPPATARKGAASAPPITFQSAYSDIINEACDKHGVDPALVHAIVKVESDFNAYAVSRKGAMGLMQLMPQTAVELNVRNTFSPTENIHGGVKYIRYLIDRYEGNIQLALAAYNAGETSVKRWGTIPPFRETQQYVKKIMRIYTGGSSDVVAPVVRPSRAQPHSIYVGYASDGTLVVTDDPAEHGDTFTGKKRGKRL